MYTAYITLMAFKHCNETNFEFKHSEEAQGGNTSTLVADSVLTDPEDFCVGSL